MSNSAQILNTAVLADAKPSEQTSITDEIHSDEVSKTPVTSDEEYEYIAGFKLTIVMVSVTMVAFLMMLDLSIISTVSQSEAFLRRGILSLKIMYSGYSSYHKRFPLSG